MFRPAVVVTALFATLLLSSCGTSNLPCIVSRDRLMTMASGPRSKIWTYHYIGATSKGVYLEANESRIFKGGSQTYVYMAPRAHFTEADLAKLEAGRQGSRD